MRNLVFAILLAISFVSVSTLITLFSFGKVISSLDWGLLIFSFLFLVFSVIGILTQRTVGYYATSIYLLLFLVMVIQFDNLIIMVIGLILFFYGLVSIVRLHKKMKDNIADVHGDKEGQKE